MQANVNNEMTTVNKREQRPKNTDEIGQSHGSARRTFAGAVDGRSVNKYGEVASRIDPSTGLRSAFPGLDDRDNGEIFYGPANDGMDYLKMVR